MLIVSSIERNQQFKFTFKIVRERISGKDNKWKMSNSHPSWLAINSKVIGKLTHFGSNNNNNNNSNSIFLTEYQGTINKQVVASGCNKPIKIRITKNNK